MSWLFSLFSIHLFTDIVRSWLALQLCRLLASIELIKELILIDIF